MVERLSFKLVVVSSNLTGNTCHGSSVDRAHGFNHVLVGSSPTRDTFLYSSVGRALVRAQLEEGLVYLKTGLVYLKTREKYFSL